MKIRTLLAMPVYVVWLVIYYISLLVAFIGCFIAGDTHVLEKGYGKEYDL